MHAQGLLVLEDDVEFSRGFMQEWGTAKASLDALEGGWEYVCVGGDQHLGDKSPDDVVGNFGSGAGGGILKVEKYVNCHGHAYLLTKVAAQLLLDRAAEEGIHCGASQSSSHYTHILFHPTPQPSFVNVEPWVIYLPRFKTLEPS